MPFKLVARYFVVALFLLSACQEKEEQSLFQLIEGEDSGILFTNSLIENDSINVLEFMNIYTGGGVAAGDVNNDGLPDLYFSGNMESSRLYLNRSKGGKIKFEDITEKAGVETNYWATGVNMLDINQDGLTDIYVCASGSRSSVDKKNKLYINQGLKEGVPVFKELAAEYGLDDANYTTQAAFFDYDLDGDLDVFMVVNHAENFKSNTINVPVRLAEEFDQDRSPRLYKNFAVERLNKEAVPGKQFMDVSLEAGIKEIGYGLGIAISDLNNDGWPDVYVTCDFLTNDILYENNQDGTFTNKIADYFTYTSYAGMGVDIADINNDGKTDIGVVDMTPEDNFRLKSMRHRPNYHRLMNELKKGYAPQFSQNTLQLNNGKGSNEKVSFSEISRLAGVHHTDWSWAALFADFDNDGHKDYFVANGFKRDMQDLDYINYAKHSKDDKELLNTIHKLPGVKIKNYVYRNTGNVQFENKTEEWGLNETSYSNGALFSDLDDDGDLDIVVNNIDEKAFVYKNTSSEKKDRNHFVTVNFAGPQNNKQGIGARVEIVTPNNFQLYENNPTRGFQSSVNASIVAGTGKNKVIEEIKVVWPDGLQQVLNDVPADTSITFDYRHSRPPSHINQPEAVTTLFKESKEVLYRDQENDFVDFSQQLTIPFKLSESGPGISVGDINGDGREDFFVGGSTNHPGALFIKEDSGGFAERQLPASLENEDLGSILFDADGDGDLDLYVVSGSVEQKAGAPAYQDRLYVNDGKGNFEIAENAIPSFLISGSTVVAADFDKDGDLDLFVGGRVKPGKYPLPTSSKLLLNESKGKDQPLFKDATDHLLPSLNNLGMVTAALWTDFDNDSWLDLMIVGDGIPVSFYQNKNGRFSSKPIVLKSSTGYWNSIVSADFDLDGDTDYIIGNLGLNSLLKASEEEAVNLYAKDVDANGTLDPILFHYVKGENVPFHTRDEMIDQVFLWRAYFPTYQAYASTSFDFFSSNEIFKDAYHIKYDNFHTSYLENKGNGEFKLRAMPLEAQYAPVQGMLTADFDNDGIQDVLMAGNSYAGSLYVGWMGASVGKLFKGNGDGSFMPVDHNESGFFVDGKVRSMVEFISDDQLHIVVSRSDDSLKVFQFEKRNQLIIPLEANDAFAEIEYQDGAVEKREFYYGSAYLSHTSRHLKIPRNVRSVRIYDFKGNAREVTPSLISEQM